MRDSGSLLLEAMACGLPTIISDIQVFREIFKDNSLFVNPYNIDDIKNNLFRALTDECLQKGLSNKRQEARLLFKWEIAAKKTLDIYRDFGSFKKS